MFIIGARNYGKKCPIETFKYHFRNVQEECIYSVTRGRKMSKHVA